MVRCVWTKRRQKKVDKTETCDERVKRREHVAWEVEVSNSKQQTVAIKVVNIQTFGWSGNYDFI
ncbi:hypothetical protein F441_19471 [Phytophthora nicotianae CJ01A1]|uniref:Uncharacterized protein n=1 Tax=Phytophthora nicotianae CJ01A1 TaxID=1317063 RepID=W2W1U7_PHYNI|nr:hypothetical protein F441_19471 [Phytophthora nicotianae CJ01A1]